MINVAIIGAGNIAPSHIRGLKTFPERCRIVAICDIYPEKAENMKKLFELDCKIYGDYKEMLDKEPEIDLVHVCTPPYTHAELAITSMDHGKNVICEKPMATCLAECDEMIKARDRNGVLFSSIAQNRFRNDVYKLKRIVDSDMAGKICMAQVNSFWWRGHCYFDLWWRGTWAKEGGGPTLNHAVHHIDMLNWLEGKLPCEVSSILTNVMHDNSEVEDLSLAIMKYEDGSLASVTSSVVHHGEEQGIELQCADAKVSFPWSVKAELSSENGFYKQGGNEELIKKLNSFHDEMPDLAYTGHTGQIDNVLAALENKTEPMIQGEDGRKTIELITAIYKAGLLKESVKLPIEPGDEFYTFDGIMKHAIHFHEKSASIANFLDTTITY